MPSNKEKIKGYLQQYQQPSSKDRLKQHLQERSSAPVGELVEPIPTLATPTQVSLPEERAARADALGIPELNPPADHPDATTHPGSFLDSVKTIGSDFSQSDLTGAAAGAFTDPNTGNITGQILQKAGLIEPQEFKPQTSFERLTYLAAEWRADPIADIPAIGAAKVAARAAKLTEKSAKLSRGAKIFGSASSIGAESRKALAAKRTVEGAAAGATVSTAQSSLDPDLTFWERLQQIALGAVFGAGLGRIGGGLENNAAVKRDAQAAQFKKLFADGADLHGPVPPGINPELFKQTRKITVRASRIEKEMAKLQTKIRSNTLTPEAEADAYEALAKLDFKRQGVVEEFGQLGDSSFAANVRRAAEKTKGQLTDVVVNIQNKNQKGAVIEQQPLWTQTVSSKNVFVPEADLLYYRTAGVNGEDITPIQKQLSATRVAQIVDGDITGKFRRQNIDSIVEAQAKSAQEVTGKLEALRTLKAAAGADSPEANLKIVKALEDPSQRWTLTPAENKYAEFLEKEFADLRERMNVEYLARGENPVALKENFFPHMRMVAELEDAGERYNPQVLRAFRKEKKPFFGSKKQRTKEGLEGVNTDIEEVYQKYLTQSLRVINLQGPAARVEANIKLMPKNLRSYMERWLDTAVTGRDAKDAAIEAVGADSLANIAHGITRLGVGAATKFSVPILTQQGSQVLSTAAITGARNTAKGILKAVASPVAKRRYKKSTFGTLRNLDDELYSTKIKFLKTGDKVLNAPLAWSDSIVAQASWHAAYDQAVKLRLNPSEASKYADNIAARLHAQYTDLFRPPLARGKSGKTLFPVQTYALNQFEFFAQDQKFLAKLTGSPRWAQFAKMVGAAYGTNLLYEAAGLEGPFKWEQSVPFLGSVAYDGDLLAPMMKNASQELAGMYALMFKNDVQLMKESGLADLIRMYMTEDEKFEEDLVHTLLTNKALRRFAPGGAQIIRTKRGLRALKDGYYDIGFGDSVDLTDNERLVAPLTGPNNLQSVRKAREEKTADSREDLGLDALEQLKREIGLK